MNELPCLPKAKWSLNGDVMYFVESEDVHKVSDILGLFRVKNKDSNGTTRFS